MAWVIDENVLVVANDLTRVSQGKDPLCPEANDVCRIRCAERLASLVKIGQVVLDMGSEYFDKYRSHAELSGQPGIGDAFVKAVYEKGYSDWSIRVRICDDNGYILPEDIINSSFDRDDFLWVAGAFNCRDRAVIINAVDSDYRDSADLFINHGILVKELCC